MTHTIRQCRAQNRATCRIHGNPNSTQLTVEEHTPVHNDLTSAGEALFQQVIDPRDHEAARKVIGEHELWLAMPSGSALYGLATPASDRDYLLVVAPVVTAKKGYNKQRIIGDADFLMCDFPTFVEQSQEGVPRAVEGMFSQLPVESPLDGFRANFRAFGGTVHHKHREMVKNSFIKGENQELPLAARQKARRHSLRLLRNLNLLLDDGRFNPQLSPAEVAWVRKYSEGDDDAYYAEVHRLAERTGMPWSEVPLPERFALR